MKRIFGLLVLCVACIGSVQASLLSDCLARLEQSTLRANITLSIASDATQPLNYTGTLVMCGERFHVTILDYDAAYDGQTLSIYAEDTDELTLSHPSTYELAEINPFVYARELIKVCNIVESTRTITLTPKDASHEIDRFVLRLNDQLDPISLELKEGKKLTTVTLHAMDNQPLVSESLKGEPFSISPRSTTYINDLR